MNTKNNMLIVFVKIAFIHMDQRTRKQQFSENLNSTPEVPYDTRKYILRGGKI